MVIYETRESYETLRLIVADVVTEIDLPTLAWLFKKTTTIARMVLLLSNIGTCNGAIVLLLNLF
jgi:hypothetical protein